MLKLSDDISSFYRAVLRTVASQGLALLISFVGSVLLTRALGSEGRGIVAWMIALSSIGVLLGQAGMGHVNRRFLADRKHRAPTLFTLSVLICIAVSLLAIALLTPIALSDDIGRNNQIALFISLLSIPITAITLTTGEMLIGLKKGAQFSTLTLIEKIANTLLIVFFVFVTSISPVKAIIAILLASIIRLLITLYYLRDSIKWQLQNAKSILSHTGSFAFFNYAGASLILFCTHLVTLLVGGFTNAAEVGWFSANMILITALRQLAYTTALYALPKLASTKNLAKKKALKLNITTITFVLTFLAALPLILFAEFAITLIFGIEFAPSTDSFKVLLVGFVFSSLLSVFQAFISAESKNFIITIAPITLVISTILTSVLFIKDGAIGAAYSWSISHAAAAIVSAAAVLYLHKKSVRYDR